jgi:hypothetical protein
MKSVVKSVKFVVGAGSPQRDFMAPDGNPTRLEEVVGWLAKQNDERAGEYRAKADPHGGAPHVARLVGMVAQAEAELDEADLDDEATQSPIDLLDFVLDGDLTGFAAKLGGNGGLLNQAMWFDQPVPGLLEDGPTLPMVAAFFRSVGPMRHCLEIGFDLAIADSRGRFVGHFAAAGGSVGIFTKLAGSSGSTCSIRMGGAPRTTRR